MSLAMVVVVALVMAVAPAAHAAGKVVVDSFGSPTASAGNTGAGQLRGAKGLAVNRSGAGGVDAGDVYVVDTQNNRLQQFGRDGDFVRAWGWDVVDGNAETDFEVCQGADVCKTGLAGSGAGQLSAPQGVAIDPDTGSVYVTSFGNRRVDVFSATGEPEVSFGFDVVASGPGDRPPDLVNEEQAISLFSAGGQVTGGTFTLSFGGQVTAPIAYDASSASVESSLQALSSVGAGGVSVSGDPGGPWRVEFTGPLAGTDVAQLSGNASGLTGTGFFTTVSVTTDVGGGASPVFEICGAGDVCQAGVSGSGPGQFAGLTNSLPSVDPSSRHLYVPSPGNLRVDEFEVTFNAGEVADVSFVRGFGWGVNPTSPGDDLEQCTTASGCRAGVAGAGRFSTGNPQSVAIGSSGSVYAVNRSAAGGTCFPDAFAPCRVFEFTGLGGNIQVADFAPAELTVSGTPSNINSFDVAVDPGTGHVFVSKRAGTSNTFRLHEFDDQGNLLASSPVAGVLTTSTAANHGLAIGTEGRLYFTNSPNNAGEILILDPPPPPTVTVSAPLNIGTTTATFRGTVTPPGGGLETFYYFEYSTNGVSWNRWPAEDDIGVGSGSSPVDVSQEVSGLQPNATYVVRLVASTGTSATSPTTTFTTGVAGPTVSATVADRVRATSARLTAQVNPNNQSTSYHFEWGTDSSYGNRIPVDFDPVAGSGGSPVKVTAQIDGLQRATVYHFRVVAENATGIAEGPDQAFMTLNDAGLPQDRGYELVSPADKGPVGFVDDLLGNEMRFQVAGDGQDIFYPIVFGTEAATAGGVPRYRGGRGPGGWETTQATPPSEQQSSQHGPFTTAGRFQYLSDDLSCRLLASPQALTDDAPQEVLDAGGAHLYRQDSDGSYTVISNLAPTNPEQKSTGPDPTNEYAVVGASDDCSRIVFETKYSYPGVADSELYEWDDGTLRNVAVRPDDSVPTEAHAGSVQTAAPTNGSIENAVSADGSRVFFTAKSNDAIDDGKQAIYIREGGSSTVKASASETATAPNGALFQFASTEGDHVLFLANYGLTAAPSNGPINGICGGNPPYQCDLYDFNVETGDLTNLSATDAADNPAGATVAGVLGASDDAGYVYFAAQGRLVADEGRSYARNLAENTYNVYLSRDGELAHVGLVNDRLINSAALLQHVRNVGVTPNWTTHVTADGRHMVFGSDAEITGYDSGGVTEAYRYSADSDETVCVSCRTDGRPSVGDVGTAPLPGRSAVQNLRRPLAITADGSRVFFTMPDALTEGAADGNENLYVWEQGQTYLLATGTPGLTGSRPLFVGASTSGDDAFLVTTQRLAPQDTDDVHDLYDVRVGGGFPPPVASPPPCDPLADGGCQGPAIGAPTSTKTETETDKPGGDGNASPGARKTLRVGEPSRKARRRAARTGRLAVVVRVSEAGKVRAVAKGRIGKRTRRVARKSVQVRKAGRATLRLRLNRAARQQLSRGKALKLSIRVTSRGARSRSITVRLPGGKS